MATHSIVNSPPYRASDQHFSAYIVLGPYRKDSQERCLASILQTNHCYIHLRGPIGMNIVNNTRGTQAASRAAHHGIGIVARILRQIVGKWVWTVDPVGYY